ncbi:MAG: class I SAM-dependent methyltransferase [Thermoanaerobaculia bacterium]
MSDRDDRYSRVQYRHLIAWPARIQREAPLLERILGSGPSDRILDLGSGPGDHARFLASRGFDVTGVDASEAMMEMANEEAVPENVRFVHGDFRNLGALVDGTFGGAICLGNVLPHLTAVGDLESLAKGLGEKLDRSARFLLQILNYRRMVAQNERALPVNVRSDPDDPDAEIVFLRVTTLPDDEGQLRFFPTTLRLKPDADPPIEVIASKRVDLHAWTRSDIAHIFGGHGIKEDEVLGAFDGTPFDEATSRDLIWIGRRT